MPVIHKYVEKSNYVAENQLNVKFYSMLNNRYFCATSLKK